MPRRFRTLLRVLDRWTPLLEAFLKMLLVAALIVLVWTVSFVLLLHILWWIARM